MSEKPVATLRGLQSVFNLRDDTIAEPDICLGAQLGKMNVDGHACWSMSADNWLWGPQSSSIRYRCNSTPVRLFIFFQNGSDFPQHPAPTVPCPTHGNIPSQDITGLEFSHIPQLRRCACANSKIMALRQRKAKDTILPLFKNDGDTNCDNGTETNGKGGSGRSSRLMVGIPAQFGTVTPRKHSKGEPNLLHTVYLPLIAFFACALGFAYLTISGGQSSHHLHTRYHHLDHKHPQLIQPRKKYHQHTAGRLKGQGLDANISEKRVPKTTTQVAHGEKPQHLPVAVATPSAAAIKVRCPDGAIGYLNDDFCDCADGSDESTTSACSHLTVQKPVFHCSDGTAIVFASRVRDGIKDCLDGSDEL